MRGGEGRWSEVREGKGAEEGRGGEGCRGMEWLPGMTMAEIHGCGDPSMVSYVEIHVNGDPSMRAAEL